RGGYGLCGPLCFRSLHQRCTGRARRTQACGERTLTTNLILGLLGIPVVLLMVFLRVPIGLAMMVVGVVGTWLVTKTFNPVMSQFKTLTYSTFASHSLSVVPLFLLMGQFATMSGLSTKIFKAATAWLGHRKGGVAMAAIGASAGFGSIVGSSLATAATMGKVAL